MQTTVTGAEPFLWTARESSRDWYSVASSADGNKLIAVVCNGLVYTSTDAGVSWTARIPYHHPSRSGTWAIASSADGNKVVAGQDGGQLYTTQTSTFPGAAGHLEGTSGSSGELKYLGSCVYEGIDSCGTVTANAKPI